MPHLEEDIITVLVAAGVGVAGTDILRGPMIDVGVPDKLVTVLQYDGSESDPDVGGAKEYRQRYVQIEIRGDKNDYLSARDTADVVRDALNLAEPAGYVLWRASEPTFIEKDTSSRSRFSVRVRVETHD